HAASLTCRSNCENRERPEIGRSLLLALGRFLPARTDRLEILPLLDGRAEQLARPFRVGLRAALELRRRPADEAAGPAVAAAVEARVAMRAVHLEGAVRLKEAQRLGLGHEHSGIDHQYASTTDFFSR